MTICYGFCVGHLAVLRINSNRSPVGICAGTTGNGYCPIAVSRQLRTGKVALKAGSVQGVGIQDYIVHMLCMDNIWKILGFFQNATTSNLRGQLS